MGVFIEIPPNVTLLVKDGQKIDFNTPLYKKIVKKTVKVPLAKELDVKPDKIFHVLTKAVGSEIKMGEVLARKKNLITEKKYFSEHEGIVKEINHNEGTVIISIDTDDENVKHAHFKGVVKDIKDKKIEIDFKKAQKFPLVESSSNFGGEFFLGKDVSEIKQEDIDKKVLVIKELESYIQVRLEVMGALGFVMMTSPSQDSSIPYARIKSSTDWEEIKKIDLPYVFVDSKNNVIYFYSS